MALSRSLKLGALCFAITLAAGTALVGATFVSTREPLAPLREPPLLDPSKVALGGALFADPILSGKGQLSCMTCHDLRTGGTIHVKRTIGYMGRVHRFNAPTIFNVGNNYRLGWRGDFTSLEQQNEKVLLDENIMAVTWDSLLSRLQADPSYSAAFQRIYGHNVDRTALLDTLAVFQRSLITPNSAFDRYLQGETGAMNSKELEGYRLFKDYGCASCHQGSNIGGNMFQKFGIFSSAPAADDFNDSDLGRFTLTNREADKGVFRVPSLRNVAVTAPYFHDGRASSLNEAVSTMAQSQLGRTLTTNEIDALVAFLNTLTGEYDGHKLSATSKASND
ncbi:cytochrome-c peroxidase [Rhizobium mayense]|uniref:Cytochrome c peroxidase n=1 Tax=Rhizobium mayense TaxID=1312184 RepID=A0ABT7K6Q0_9HYPH|nr:cytochrome c peroxidase [Rhizobium mayense]MDL2403653.1 cytochrome c peroxidase [Rhizobium mayense]